MTDKEKMEMYPENWYAMFVAILDPSLSIYQALRYMGFEMKPKISEASKKVLEKLKEFNQPKFKIDKDWLHEKRISGYTNAKIAEMIGCSTSTVSKAVRDYDLPKTSKVGRPRKKEI